MGLLNLFERVALFPRMTNDQDVGRGIAFGAGDLKFKCWNLNEEHVPLRDGWIVIEDDYQA